MQQSKEEKEQLSMVVEWNLRVQWHYTFECQAPEINNKGELFFHALFVGFLLVFGWQKQDAGLERTLVLFNRESTTYYYISTLC